MDKDVEVADALELNVTARGFGVMEFQDGNGEPCSIQCSSAWRENDFNPIGDDPGEETLIAPGTSMLWLGVDDPNPQIMRSYARELGLPDSEGDGWMAYPIPKGAYCSTRMHLTRANAAALGEMLTVWANTGELAIPSVGRLGQRGE